MNIKEIRKNAPSKANAYIKKPLCKLMYLHGHDGIYWFIDDNNRPIEMCRDWRIWIKHL